VSHNCYACIGAVPTMAPTTPGEDSGTDAASKKGSSAGAIDGSILGGLVRAGVGYYFYSQKQATAMSAAEIATTGLEVPNKI
jgi:hypothetical protein